MTTKQYGIFASSLILLLFLQALPTSAEIYKYIDDKGIIHYTDNQTTIPPEYRPQLEQYVERAASSTEITTKDSSERIPPSGVSIPETAIYEIKLEVHSPTNNTSAISGTSADMEISRDSESPSSISDNFLITEEGEPNAERVNDPDFSGSDHVQPSANSPSDQRPEASRPDVIEPASQKVSKLSSETKSERNRQLGEQRTALEEKVKQLDQQYRSVLEERKRLENQRRNLNSKSEIESYNLQVQQLNDKIQEYRNQRQTLEFEVRTFNDSIAR